MHKILIIEDDPDVADLVKTGLIYEGFEVELAQNGREGLDLARSNCPDLVVLDLMLPDMDGIDLCRELRADGDVGIVIMTARGMVGERVRGLQMGADDYVPKPFVFEELVARIKAVLRRRSVDSVICVADLSIDLERREARRGDRSIDLTTREFELLKLLVQNVGKPLSRDFILQRVWGYDFESDTDPVKVYINFLRRKLNAEGEPDLIHSMRGFGYVLKEPSCE